jgi:hypothetical protein
MKSLDEGVHQKEEMFDQQKNLVKKRYVLNESGDSGGNSGVGGSDVPVSE